MDIPKRKVNISRVLVHVVSIKFAEVGPNRHTTNWSRSCSNVVEDVSGSLLGEEDGGSDFSKKQKVAKKRHIISGASLHLSMSCFFLGEIMCLEKSGSIKVNEFGQITRSQHRRQLNLS